MILPAYALLFLSFIVHAITFAILGLMKQKEMDHMDMTKQIIEAFLPFNKNYLAHLEDFHGIVGTKEKDQ